uniref:RNA pseudouridine synthase 3 isoform X2 n=1 Tax=Rhizophora mucronata TaxID=61149 RepID=A0A2P2II98_RHIMU
MWKTLIRHYSRIAPPRPVEAKPVIRVSKNVAELGSPKEGPKPRQLLSLPPFPGVHRLPGKNTDGVKGHVTAISWVKYYFSELSAYVIQSHFNKGLVYMECRGSTGSIQNERQAKAMRKIEHSNVMEEGARVYIPVSVAEMRISKRFDTIPSGTLHPNADEIAYLQRLVKYKACRHFILPGIFSCLFWSSL